MKINPAYSKIWILIITGILVCASILVSDHIIHEKLHQAQHEVVENTKLLSDIKYYVEVLTMRFASMSIACFCIFLFLDPFADGIDLFLHDFSCPD